MHDIPPATLKQFAAAARKVSAHGLQRCSSGNLSYRLDDTRMLIKTTHSWMAELTPDHIALCRIADGAPLNGKKPSVEIGFHAGLLRTRKDINVVLHFQTPFATTLACREPRVENFYVIPEIAFYIGSISTVPYFHGGSTQLAEAVTAALQDANLAVLLNHGQVTVGETYDEAIQRAVFFELACQVIVQNGPALRRFTPEVIQELRNLSAGGKGV